MIEIKMKWSNDTIFQKHLVENQKLYMDSGYEIGWECDRENVGDW